MKIGKYITLKHEELVSSGDSVGRVTITEENQIRPFEAVIVSENNRFCEVKGIRDKHTLDIHVTFSNEKNIVKFLQPNNTISKIKDFSSILIDAVKNKSPLTALQTMILPKIYDADNNLIGTFDNHFVDNGNVRQNYNCLKLNYKDKNYFIYSTPSHINQNAAWVVYEDDTKLVSEILVDKHKGFSSNRDLFKYDIYALNDEYFKLACILTVAWMKMTGKEEKQFEATDIEHLRNKYSAEFVENIRSNINPSYLPENMPLVEELYNEGKYELHRTIKRMVVIVPLILLILLVIYVLLFN